MPGAPVPLARAEPTTEYELLFITCSKQKDDTDMAIPLIMRYDGPKFRCLRKQLKRLTGAHKDAPFTLDIIPGWLEIRILSGWYGLLHPGDTSVPYYDSKGVMRKGLQANVIYRLNELKQARGPAGHILVIGGLRAYNVSFTNMEKFMGCSSENLEMIAKGPGLQMKGMIEWLQARFYERTGEVKW